MTIRDYKAIRYWLLHECIRLQVLEEMGMARHAERKSVQRRMIKLRSDRREMYK